jgi:hypothetical protein
MFFLDAATGAFLSHFMADRLGEEGYCSAHMGMPMPTTVAAGRCFDIRRVGGLSTGVRFDHDNPQTQEQVADG